ncbi:Zonadhesin, partial [Stegodyphus mimosarum]
MHDDVEDISFASPPQNSLGPIKTQVSGLNLLDNKMREPFLQHISDNAVLPSTGQVNNDLDKIRKIQSSQNQYPTGLVTVLGGTFVDGPSTTIYETKVIGTYIDGKYAQILQSTSHIVAPSPSVPSSYSFAISSVSRGQNKETPQVSMDTFKMLSQFSSTASMVSPIPQIKLSTSSITKSVVINPTPVISVSGVSKTVNDNYSSKGASQSANVLNSLSIIEEKKISTPTFLKASEDKSSQKPLESSFSKMDSTVIRDTELPTESLENVRRSSVLSDSFRLPIISTVIRLPDEDNTVVAQPKSHRNSTPRNRFLSPRRPSQSVQLNRFKVKLTLRHDSTEEYNVTLPSDDEDLEEDHTNKAEDETEVVTEGIGAAVDPARVVFQETTITSEVTLHVGRRKSVRTLTITTSVPLTVNPTDIQDILASQSTAMDRENTASDAYNIVTRTFTTTERALKTSVVPIFDGKQTTFHTVTESFFIMKIITAYRTLPPGDATVLESIFDEPEISATTLEVAANIQPSVIQSPPPDQISTESLVQPSITLPSGSNNNPQLTNPLLSLGHALSNNPLAAVYLGLQQLNAQMTLYSTVTDTSTYVTTETFYSTKTIRLYDGRSTRYRKISEPVSTKKSTVTTTVTSVQPYLNTHALQQQQQLQKLIAATQLPPQPQYSTLTSTYTTVTVTSSLSTRIYTLIYNGFSTKFRTVTSTTTYPTTVVITSTTKVPIAPSQVNVPFVYPYSA